MIRPIDIRLNAAHPELPLAESVTFTGSPSTVLIRGVPPNCGRWAITAVFVAATYPDGSTTTRAAVQSANGVWVATLPATARSGRTENGLRVMADGIDETGEAVTGYILGVADFAVASLGVTPAPEPGETSWQMLYFDAVPGTLRKGDVAKVDGVLKLYNGTAWEAFATPPALDDTVTSSSANGVKSSGIWSAIWGTASTAFSSLYDWCVAQLAGKASKADATLTDASEWRILHTPLTAEQKAAFYAESEFAASNDYKVKIEEFAEALYLYVGGYIAATVVISEDGLKATFDSSQSQEATTIWGPNGTTVATRTAKGYRLGPDEQTNPNRDKPLASEAEAEALRAGKLDKSGDTMTGALTVQENLTVGSREAGSAVGVNSVAEGRNNTASGSYSHAEGNSATASGLCSHAEGAATASGGCSHAEGAATASGSYSHAEGNNTTADGSYSHAEGRGTGAQNVAEHAQGRFNVSHKSSDTFGDAGNTLSSIGFGTAASARKNAVETMQDGKTYIYGLGGYDGTNPTNATDLAAVVNAKADVSAIPYSLGTPIVINEASTEVVEGETVNYGAATLANRTSNIVQVTAATALDELRITFPAATSGKVRDFGLRVEIGTGSAALAAPALVPIAPTGETIKIENNAKEIPALADGTATAKGVTLLYFSENAPGVFVVKGEQVEEVA